VRFIKFELTGQRVVIIQGMRQIFTPPGGPPQGPPPNPEIYRAMGEANVFKMLSDFYKELEQSEIRHLFPADMEEASQKSAAFFVTILGGPPLYMQRYGPPRMRARHLPFVIDERARQVWLACFDRVLEGADVKYQFPLQHLQGFKDFLQGFSAWMVNQA
jgi:hemoglobin